jgi:hypothetical protein
MHARRAPLTQPAAPAILGPMDIRRDDLDAAVDAGILDAAARDRVLAFVRARAQGTSGPDDESFRLLTGFNDIFVTLACVLLLGAIPALLPNLPAAAVMAAASWGLAEYFTARRRMALPSILLLLAFVGSVFAVTFLAVTWGGHMGRAAQQAFGQGFTTALWAPLMVSGLAGAAAAALHWRRFRVPITLAAGAAALAVGAVALAGSFLGERAVPGMALLSGLAIFGLAMRYDISDRERLTRSTDIAFWLHLLAAPLIIHPIFALSGLMDAAPGPGAALLVLVVYLALTLVALAIDRRALLVSALAYVIFALQGLFESGQVAAGFGLTALVLGTFLVMLSAAWGSLRRRLLLQLPAGWTGHLPLPG